MSLDQVTQSSTQLGLEQLQERETMVSLGNLLQCLTTLTRKNFFLTTILNLPFFSLRPFPLVLSLHTLVKGPSPDFLQGPFRYWSLSLESPFLQAEQSQLRQFAFIGEVFQPWEKLRGSSPGPTDPHLSCVVG